MDVCSKEMVIYNWWLFVLFYFFIIGLIFCDVEFYEDKEICS